MKGKGMGMRMEKGRLHRQRVAIVSTVQVQSKYQSWTGNPKYQIRTVYSECSWGFEERSGANPALPSLLSPAARQHWTPPRISYRRDAEGRSCGRGASGRSNAADGGNLDLTHLEPCPALPCVACLPCLDQENLARLRVVVDFGSGLLSAGAVAPLCCPTLAHSLTPSLPPSRPTLACCCVPPLPHVKPPCSPFSLSLWILDQTRRSWRLQLCEGFFAQAKTLDLGILEPVEQSCWVCTLQAAGVSGTRPPLLCVCCSAQTRVIKEICSEARLVGSSHERGCPSVNVDCGRPREGR
jgi:hypothetical protein